jgi:hypothetical protein
MCCHFIVWPTPRITRGAQHWMMSECLVLWGLATVYQALAQGQGYGGLPYNTAIFVVFVAN